MQPKIKNMPLNMIYSLADCLKTLFEHLISLDDVGIKVKNSIYTHIAFHFLDGHGLKPIDLKPSVHLVKPFEMESIILAIDRVAVSVAEANMYFKTVKDYLLNILIQKIFCPFQLII